MMTFEYVLIEDINDTEEQAKQLAAIARETRAKINLIPYNEVEGLPFKRPSRDRCKAFQRILEDHGSGATLRQEKGGDIDAACGQLRLQHETKSSN
jgi:23S rRNA (adenine2503-C2)-methyltransferase